MFDLQESWEGEMGEITIFLSEANPDFYSHNLHSSSAASQDKAARRCPVYHKSTSSTFSVAVFSFGKSKRGAS